MKISAFELPPLGTVAYLLTDKETRQALLIDAPMGASKAIEPVLKEEACELAAVLLTHGHFDHIMDGHLFNQKGVPVYGHEGDKTFFANPSVQSILFQGLPHIHPVKIDKWLHPKENLKIAGYQIEVRYVPGHAPGSVLFYIEAMQTAFVGDTVFSGGVGRVDIPGGNAATLRKSIREQIFTLPDATILYPGHGPSTTVANEKL